MNDLSPIFEPLRAPYVWFGGKSKVAPLIWERFGKTRRYVEPFFGSGAVFLRNPHWEDTFEVINDLDHFVANCWRALKSDPAIASHYAATIPNTPNSKLSAGALLNGRLTADTHINHQEMMHKAKPTASVRGYGSRRIALVRRRPQERTTSFHFLRKRRGETR